MYKMYKIMAKYRREYLFFVPAFIITVGIIIYPFLYNLINSFTRTNIRLGQDFIGLGNYKELVLSSRFLATYLRTTAFSILTALGSVLAGSLMAVVVYYLDWKSKSKYILLTFLFIPWVLSDVVIALIWKWLLNPILGPFCNLFLGPFCNLFNLSMPQYSLLGNPDTALIAVLLVYIWKNSPFAMITIFAALQSLPKSPLEAANIDGANSWQQLRYIIIPELRPIITTVTLILAMWHLGAFTITYLMTKGGPSYSTELLSIYIYNQFKSIHFGLASTAAVFLFFLACLLILVYFKAEFKRMEEV